jgi:amino acid transporter
VSGSTSGRLGTFSGVFTPSVLTILGLILFLRLGYVVGITGLGETLIIIALANVISVVTSISLGAVATNLKVKGGGVYYIISRTLGLPFGGAIGLVLFAAQAISVGFYCVGFAEGLTAIFGIKSGLAAQAIAAAAVAATVLLAWIGSDWATRFQYVVMAMIVAAILSFAIGVFGHWNPTYLAFNFGSFNGWGNFWIAFAIFFPAVTGFTQGVNMSGDLADAGKSIPRGTAYAVGLSFVIYILVAIGAAATLPRSELISNYGSMKSVAVFAPLIDAGIIAATLSSALASLLGAPRILQTLAKDRVFSFLLPFAAGAGPTNNPRRGVLLTGAIALAIVALGNLNLIASVVSMFFVVTYGLLNYATYYEARGKSPAFRPTLRWYDPWISFAGGIGALGVMLAINIPAGLAATAIVFGIYQYLKRSAIAARWADGQRSYNLQIVREHLLEANARAEHPRDWRPQILAFSDGGVRRDRMLTFASWIEGHSGLTTVVRILEGKGKHIRRIRDEAEEELAEDLKEKSIRAFPLVIASEDLDTAVRIAVQSVGVGPTRINSILLNWIREDAPSEENSDTRRFARNVHAAFSLGCNILVLDSNEAEWKAAVDSEAEAPRIVDVWWRDNRTGRLMLVLAYLLTRNDTWRDATIRLIVVAEPDAADSRRAHLEKMLRDVRIHADVHIVPSVADKIEQIAGASADALIVFLPLSFRDEWFADWLDNDLSKLLPKLPLTVLTMAAEDVDLSADPDEGEESERAAAKDALEDASRKKAASAKAVEDLLAKMTEISKAPTDEKSAVDSATELGKLQSELAACQGRLAQEEAALGQARAAAEKYGIKLDGEATD